MSVHRIFQSIHSYSFLSYLRMGIARGWRRTLCLLLICGLLIFPDTGYTISYAAELAVQVAKNTIRPVPAAFEWFRHLYRGDNQPRYN